MPSLLGVKCDKFLSSQCCVRDACTKQRGTLLSITNIGFPVNCLNPISLRTIYISIVVPKTLYGCEVWDTLSTTDMQSLESSHRFCIKYIQSMLRNTSSNLALCALNLLPIETVIDQRKLVFLGQLCRLPNTNLAKLVFNQKLIRFLNYDSQMNGFIPDMYRILQKYGLCEVIYTYVKTGLFPAKCAWKSTLNTIYSPILINVLSEDNVFRLWSNVKSHSKYYPISPGRNF